MRTVNGGQNWDIIPSGTREYLYDIWFADRTHGWAVGSHHTILATRDGGENWVKQNGPASGWSFFTSVCFIDPLHGWVAGSDSGLLKTTDGGDTWTIKQSDSLTFCTAIQFTDPENGWAL